MLEVLVVETDGVNQSSLELGVAADEFEGAAGEFEGAADEDDDFPYGP